MPFVLDMAEAFAILGSWGPGVLGSWGLVLCSFYMGAEFMSKTKKINRRRISHPEVISNSQRWQYVAAREVAAVVKSGSATRPTAKVSPDFGNVWRVRGSWMFCAWIAVLLSAFFVVYSKDLSRRLFIEYGVLRQQDHALQVNWGRLLLENATLSTPARVQNIARTQLGMVLPTIKDIVMIAPPVVKVIPQLQAGGMKNSDSKVVSMPQDTQWVAASK